MLKKTVLIFLFLSAQAITATSYKLTHPLYNPGFFSVFNTVLGILDFYDTNPTDNSIEVDFEDKGLFYDEKHGSNWWNYYFEPIKLGVPDNNIRKFPTYKKITASIEAQFDLPRSRAKELLNKYVIIKPHILSKIDHFTSTHFTKKTIGIHYRGTDKKCEAPSVSYNAITELLAKEPLDVNFFVATDDALFLEHMHVTFPERVCATDAKRSRDNKPLHYPPTNDMYVTGEEALIDCILLSKCSKLYKMASNLSDTSAKFNPDMPIVELNKSFSESTIIDSYEPFKAINFVLSLLNSQAFEGTISLPVTSEKYPQKNGHNWWEYYFESLTIGRKTSEIILPSYKQTTFGLPALFEMDRKKAFKLITKYIKFNSKIIKKVNEFAQTNFDNHYILGINYIKQHHERLQPSIAQEKLFNLLGLEVSKLPANHILFVHSNDSVLFKTIKEKYDNVVSFGLNPLDNENEQVSQEEKDEHALATCLLFAKTNKVIGTATDLLKCAQQFNPDLMVNELDTLWLLAE